MEKMFYFANVFNGISKLSLLFIIFGAIGSIITIVGYFVNFYENGKDDNSTQILCKLMKPAIIILIIGVLTTIFVPDKKTYLFMCGGKVVDYIIDNNPQISEIPGNTITLLNEYLEQEVKDIKSNIKEE